MSALPEREKDELDPNWGGFGITDRKLLQQFAVWFNRVPRVSSKALVLVDVIILLRASSERAWAQVTNQVFQLTRDDACTCVLLFS